MYTINLLAHEFTQNFNGLNKLHKYENIFDKYVGLDWCKLIKHNFEGEYNKQLLFKNANFDIYLIVWKPHANVRYHDHSKNGCLFKILKGSLHEIRKLKEGKYISQECIEKKNYYIDDNIGIHSIQNKNIEYTYSLHIYSPPNYNCSFF